MGRIIFIFYEVSLSLISLKIFFSIRDTCTWEIPSRPAITVWVIFSKYRILSLIHISCAGLCAGAVIAAGIFAFLAIIGVFPRLSLIHI